MIGWCRPFPRTDRQGDCGLREAADKAVRVDRGARRSGGAARRGVPRNVSGYCQRALSTHGESHASAMLCQGPAIPLISRAGGRSAGRQGFRPERGRPGSAWPGCDRTGSAPHHPFPPVRRPEAREEWAVRTIKEIGAECRAGWIGRSARPCVHFASRAPGRAVPGFGKGGKSLRVPGEHHWSRCTTAGARRGSAPGGGSREFRGAHGDVVAGRSSTTTGRAAMRCRGALLLP